MSETLMSETLMGKTIRQRRDFVRRIIDEIIDRNSDDVLAMDQLLNYYKLCDNTEKAMFHYDIVRRVVYERKLRHKEPA